MPQNTGEAAIGPTVWRWRGPLKDAAIVLFVLALGAKATVGCATIRELDTADECLYYLLPAHRISENGLPSVEYSPLYVCWYALLIQSGRPPAEIVFLNWALLASLLPASVYILSRALGAGRLVALAVAGGLLATKLVDVWPYPAHFAAIVLALGAAAATLAVRRGYFPTAGALVGLTLLTATYCRPELRYALLAYLPPVFVAAGWAVWRRPVSRREVIGALMACLGSGVIFVWAFGNPFVGNVRSLVAVGEHYAWNRYQVDPTSGGLQNWQVCVRNDFGDVASLSDLWRNNQSAFLWHIGTNLRNVPDAAGMTAEPLVDLRRLRFAHAYPADPVRLLPLHPKAESLARQALRLAVGAGLLGAVVGLRRSRGLLVGLGLFGLVAVPALAAALIVYPRFHYLLPSEVIAVSVAAAGFRHLPIPARFRVGGRTPGVHRLAVVFVAVTLAAIVPNRANGWCVQQLLGHGGVGNPIASPATPWRDTSTTLRELHLRSPVAVLGGVRTIPFYAGLGEECVHPRSGPPGETFRACVRRADIGVVLLDPELVEWPAWKSDPDFQALVEGRESEIFRLILVRRQPTVRIAVRRDLPPAEE
jgi:hypothetical protein